jgi:hypothetical protein
MLTAAVTVMVTTVAAVAGAVAGLGYASMSARGADRNASPGAARIVVATLSARPDSYLGVYMPGVPGSYAPVESFAAAAGRQPDLALYYSGWHERFQSAFAAAASSHGSTPLVQIDPQGISLADIAAGLYDTYLDSYALAVAAYGHPVVIGFGHEMNGDWYHWGYRHVSPALFVLAWRHIHNVFNTRGARNVTWLWTVSVVGGPNVSPLASWWPGRDFVNWVGIDGYYVNPTDTFSRVFAPTIAQVRQVTPDPVLLAETGAAAGAGKSAKVADLFEGIRARGLLGFVYFDVNMHGASGYTQNWQLEDDPAAVDVFRRLAATLHTASP